MNLVIFLSGNCSFFLRVLEPLVLTTVPQGPPSFRRAIWSTGHLEESDH